VTSRARAGSSGSTLVLNVFVMAVFAMMAVIVYKSAKSMVGEAVYYERSAQALSIAEAGIEDALHSLYSTATWRTGFTNKSFAGGYYTVTVTSDSATTLLVMSSGYSPSFLYLGRAVKTVSLDVLFVSSTNPTNAAVSSNLTVNGVVNAYDPRISLTPAFFTDGGTVWANTVACGASGHIYSDVLYHSGTPPACVNTPTDTVLSTTTLVTFSIPACNAACMSLAQIGNAKVAGYLTGAWPAQTLHLTSAQTLTISSGTYYLKQLIIDGTLNVDTTSGTVNIFYTNKFQANAGCQINNLSLVPSRLVIADTSGGHTVSLQCSTPLHAYLESDTNNFDVMSGQVVYGHFSGANSIIELGATLHVDLSGAVPATHLTWSTGPSGSWTESYKRQ
jgi:hypothetical protein